MPVRVVDVRDRFTYQRSNERVAGDLRLHGKGLARALDRVSSDVSLLTYCTCHGDGMAILAAERLRRAGYPSSYAVKDGLEGCRGAGLEVVAKTG